MFCLLAIGWCGSAATPTPAAPRNHDELAASVAAIKQASLLDFTAQVHALVANATLEEIGEIRRILEQQLPAPAFDHLWAELFERWGALDGPEALRAAGAKASRARTTHETRAMVGWAKTAPDKAWEEMLVLSNRGADGRYGVQQVLLAVAEIDLPRALQFYMDLVPERACLECNAALLSVVAIKQGRLELMFEVIERMERGPFRNPLRDSLWRTLGQFLQAEAVPELRRMKNAEDYDAAEIKLYVGWTAMSPASALDEVLRIADPKRFESLVLPVVHEWARGAHPADVTDLIKRLPPDLSERSLLGLAGHLARVNPKSTMNWIVSFPPTQVRTNGLESAIGNWARIDHDAALHYIHSVTDLETRGILVWCYLFAKLDNKTLKPEDLAEIEHGFSPDWTKRLLKHIGGRLVDPRVNDTQFFDMGAFVRFVNNLPKLTEADRQEILASLGSLAGGPSREDDRPAAPGDRR